MSVVKPSPIFYPFSDGKRMAENTKQARWIFIFYGNLQALYGGRPDVFVAADNLWYPVEGEVGVCVAPDVYVVVGRPKGDRLCYKQWEEGGVPLTVAIEVLSPTNTDREMDDKFHFYDEHGVQEYYVYDPDTDRLRAWVRGRATLAPQRVAGGFISPLMGVRFDTSGPELRVFHPNGEPFLTLEDQILAGRQERRRADDAEARVSTAEAERDAAEQQRLAAEQQAAAAQQQQAAAEHQAAAAQQQRLAAEQQAAAAQQQRLAAEQQAAAAEAALQAEQQVRHARDQAFLAERQRARRLRDLGRLSQAGQATPEQMDELRQLQDGINGEP